MRTRLKPSKHFDKKLLFGKVLDIMELTIKHVSLKGFVSKHYTC